MVVLCDGMVRSGSTWSFNVALELLRSYNPQQRTFGFYTEKSAVLLAAVRPRSSHLVIKSHVLDPSAYELCCTGAIKALYTWRHPHDAIISSLRMFGYSVDHWISVVRNALRLWSFHRATGSACIISYESIRRTPVAAIHDIATYLEIQIEPAQESQIAEKLSLERLRDFSQQIDGLNSIRVVRKDGYVYDRKTLLHKNHIRDGGIGYGSALLNCEQLSAIDALLREEGFDFLL
jgi:sulfotransferase family protein